jgi:hypothetical protein
MSWFWPARAVSTRLLTVFVLLGALALPFLAEGDYLLVAAADEVPPHDDLLTERLIPEEGGPAWVPAGSP